MSAARGIRLYDTLRRAKVDFAPADPSRVTMYVCGPTVYGRAHIGNARPAVVFDVLARLLRHTYGAEALVYARNITDIDDKIIAAAAAEGVAPKVVTDRFEAHYLADMGALGVAPPTLSPHATDHIAGMVAMIGDLIGRGVAYAAAGHVLFDVAAYGDYGRLSRRPLDAMIAGARVEVAPYKKNPADFVLWKPSTADQPGWDSPWGRGRPGWHIECSAMIAAHLGPNAAHPNPTIDIHGGGLDLIFPHHENELAQSSCAHGGAPLAQVWMHNGFLSMGDAKMSKSLGNVVGVDDLLAAGWSGEVIRLALLSAHYRQPLVWSDELLAQQGAVLDRLNRASGLVPMIEPALPDGDYVDDEFLQHLGDDLNTPAAFARLHALASECDRSQKVIEDLAYQSIIPSTDDYRARLLALRRLTSSAALIGISLDYRRSTVGVALDRFLGMGDDQKDFVNGMVAARATARSARDFAESDRIRDDLAAQGIVLEDGPGGTTWRRA